MDRRTVPLDEEALPDLGMLMIGPLSMLRFWAEINRAWSSAVPASLLVASAPFFWAPPLWVGALMAGSGGGQERAARDAASAAGPATATPPSGRRRAGDL